MGGSSFFCNKGTQSKKAHKSNINITDYKLRGHVCKECSLEGIASDLTVRISIFTVPRWKNTNGNRKDTARIPQSSISLSTGKDREKESECQSSRNINYIQDKYAAIRHVCAIKIFVSCNYRKIRWDAGRYTMNFLIVQMNDWLKTVLLFWRLTVKVTFYTQYNGRELIFRHDFDSIVMFTWTFLKNVFNSATSINKCVKMNRLWLASDFTARFWPKFYILLADRELLYGLAKGLQRRTKCFTVDSESILFPLINVWISAIEKQVYGKQVYNHKIHIATCFLFIHLFV